VSEDHFRALLRDADFVTVFRDFCVERFDVENLNFILDARAYARLSSNDRFLAGLALYRRYIIVGAPMELNLPNDEREDLNQIFAHGSGERTNYDGAIKQLATEARSPVTKTSRTRRRTEFDKARHTIFRLLYYNSWLRFQTCAHNDRWQQMLSHRVHTPTAAVSGSPGNRERVRGLLSPGRSAQAPSP